MTTLRQSATMALEAYDKHEPLAVVMEELRAALEQPEQEPVALIRDGVLRWYIPHEHYSRPTWTAHGTHMLYTQPPQRNALTEDMVQRAMTALNTASCGEFQPTFDEMKSALEAAHGIKETP